MKNILLVIGSIFLSLNAFLQDFTANNVEHYKVLYRGYENQLAIDQIGCEIDDFEIEPINCEVKKLAVAGSDNRFIIKPNSSAKTAKIRFISNGEAVDSIQFVVQNLPRPYLFWGNNQTGSNFSSSSQIQFKYKQGITLKPSFEIIGWEFSHNETDFEGKGNELSTKFLEFTKSMASGETIQIVVKVKHANGEIRQVIGLWTVG